MQWDFEIDNGSKDINDIAINDSGPCAVLESDAFDGGGIDFHVGDVELEKELDFGSLLFRDVF